MSKDVEYEVGYGKPPEHTQFKKGQSGNAKGRPRKSRNFNTELDDILSAKIAVTENGKTKKVSTQKAFLLRLCEKALKGDLRALSRALDLASHRSDERSAQDAERSLTTVDEEILERFLEGALHSDNTLTENPESEEQDDGE